MSANAERIGDVFPVPLFCGATPPSVESVDHDLSDDTIIGLERCNLSNNNGNAVRQQWPSSKVDNEKEGG
jgi:hypothetical protein